MTLTRIIWSAWQKMETPDFADLNDLACEKVGGKILFVTDDWFAVAENLLKAEPAEWQEGVFTENGKWMDGWESRRKRIPGHDWCIIKLGCPGIIHGFDVDTSFFTGNYPPKVSIQAACLDQDVKFPPRDGKTATAAGPELLALAAQLKSEEWTELLPKTALKPGYPETCHNYFSVSNRQRWTHLRLNYYPDGGCARLRVFGIAKKNWSLYDGQEVIDLAAMENGGYPISCSDRHFGHPRNLIAAGRAENMGDGWETARRLDRPEVLEMGPDNILMVKGYEWALLKLGHAGIIKEVEVDTNHFKGNFPDSCKVEGVFLSEKDESLLLDETKRNEINWKTILPLTKLSAHKRHFFKSSPSQGVITHVKLTIAPDGGVSRLRLLGYPELTGGKL